MFENVTSMYALKNALKRELESKGFIRKGFDWESERSHHLVNENQIAVIIFDAAIKRRDEIKKA